MRDHESLYFGTYVIGLLTTSAVIFEGLRNALNRWNPAGPLTGKTGVGVIAWLISWVLLNTLWKGREYDPRKAFVSHHPDLCDLGCDPDLPAGF